MIGRLDMMDVCSVVKSCRVSEMYNKKGEMSRHRITMATEGKVGIVMEAELQSMEEAYAAGEAAFVPKVAGYAVYEDGELKEGLFEAKRKESRGD